MENLKLKVITPKGVIYDKEVSKVVIKSMNGEVTILKNHSSLVGGISNEIVKVYDLDNKCETYISGIGIFSVSDNLLRIIPTYFIVKTQENIDKLISKFNNQKLEALKDQKQYDNYFKLKLYIVQQLNKLKNS